MNYWILQVNPNSFHISQESPYLIGEDDWWCLTRARKIAKGDTVFIWKSIDRRNPKLAPKPRGIYARGTILSVPDHEADMFRRINKSKERDRERWIDFNERRKQESKPIDILISYDAVWETDPLTYDEIVSAGLSDIHIVKFPHLEICLVSQSNADRLQELLEKKRH